MRQLVLISLALSAAGTAVAGDIYCNTQGRECSDRPTSTANVMRSISSGAPRNASPATGDAPGGDRVAAQRAQNEQLAKARQELRQDVGGKRTAQCKEASDYYQRLITASVINKADKDGKKLAMSDAEADQARFNAKLERDKLCSEANGG
jgi:hypothetical protein